MNTWKGVFVAVLMSGVVLGIFDGHLLIWTCVGAVLGAVLAAREHQRVLAPVQIGKTQNREVA